MMSRFWRLAAMQLVAALLICPAVLADDLNAFVRGSWQQIRQEHAGRPTAIHFWGVSCAPCRTEMPVWGEILNEFPALDLVTVHADRAPDGDKTMTEMLQGAGLSKAENWWFADRFFSRLRFEVDPDWQGEIPMTVLISRTGAVTTLVGSISKAEIASWLDTNAEAIR